jgi:hypothetical protein
MGDDVQAARSEAAVQWLSSEVRDLLDVGAVGLYEFIWALRSGSRESRLMTGQRSRIRRFGSFCLSSVRQYF